MAMAKIHLQENNFDKKELQINVTTREDFFGIPTWEILEYSKISLEQANTIRFLKLDMTRKFEN